jgi:hypothetical protein
MSDHRMEHGNHKAEKPHEPSDEPQASVARDEPAAPIAETHKSLDEIPANEGGKGDVS